MPEVTKHKPGMLCWADLMTKDVAAAKKFYSGLFGWTTVDAPMPQGGPYVMAKQGGKDVAAISGMPPQPGMVPHWNAYFAVENVDATHKKALASGGKQLMPPTDVMDSGRMSVIADPSGAAFSIWQPGKHIGAQLMNEPGALAWSELETNNVDACGSFYSKVFGYKAEAMPMGDMVYTVFKSGTERASGMAPISPSAPKGTPSHWNTYFSVKDCAAIVKKAESLGGKIMTPPTPIPNVGTFAFLFDPQQSMFGVLQPK